jgi:hypothetical protein
MIPSKTIRNTRVVAPLVNLLSEAPFLEKMPIKGIYPQWRGESVPEIEEKSVNNPYSVRIGTPNTDKALQADHAFYIQSYLSYNPVTKQLEKRELIPYRNVEKVFIGEQRIDEHQYKDYTLFVNGSVVAEDLRLLKGNKSVVELITSLMDEVNELRVQVHKLQLQTQTQPIYK